MASRLIVQMVILGSGMLGRAFVQAYRQALANASRSGVAQETIQNTIRTGTKNMNEKEARMILGVTEGSSFEEILQKYNSLFENNHKNGSFYLQSKVQRAKEFLEETHRGTGQAGESEPWCNGKVAPLRPGCHGFNPEIVSLLARVRLRTSNLPRARFGGSTSAMGSPFLLDYSR